MSEVHGSRVTEVELAERTGTSVERVRLLVDLGILESKDRTFPRRDIIRLRVVLELEAKGMDAAALGAALASGHLTLGYLESAGRHPPRSNRTVAQLSEEIGIPLDTLQALFVAFGLSRPQQDEHVRGEDLAVLKTLPVLFGTGLTEREVLRAVRVWGEGARRGARFQHHYFHHTIEEPFRRRGLRDNEAFEAAIREVGLRIGHSGEDMLAWLYRRHSEAFLKEHQFGHVEAALEEAESRQRPAKGVEAAVFADLSGYTSLTEEAGDEAGASVALELANLVNESRPATAVRS